MALPNPPGSSPRPFGEYLVAAGVGAVMVGLVEQYDSRLALGLAAIILLGIGLLAHGSDGHNALAELATILQQAASSLPGVSASNPVHLPTKPPSSTGGTPTPSLDGFFFPIQGYSGAVPASHWDHSQAVDLMAPQGTPVLAVTGGRVVAAQQSAGGNTATLFGLDGRIYYYAHLASAAVSGMVQAGQQIGQVGKTGNAAGGPPHLHFALGQGSDGIDSNGAGNIAPWAWLTALLRGH